MTTAPLFIDGAATVVTAGTAAVGGKAMALARLGMLGFPVPDLAVLPTAAFRAFLNANDLAPLREATRPAAETGLICPTAASALRAVLKTAPFPPSLQEHLQRLAERWSSIAVRSSVSGEDSATASFAGIHRSQLNVRGVDALEAAIRDCWSSAWDEAALGYRHRLCLTAPIEPAILLLPMVPAVSAGVAFSQDPTNGRHDHVRIAAAFGLGEAVVQGRCEPDDIVVELTTDGSLRDRTDVRIIQWSVGRKTLQFIPDPATGSGTITTEVPPDQAATPALPEEAACDLARLARQIEDCLGLFEVAQDIEWVWDGHHLWIVQSRPITRLPEHAPAELGSQPVLWSDANVREVFPRPLSPMGWSLSRDLLQRALETPSRVTGAPPAPGIRRFRLFHGRMYLNLSQMQWESWRQFGSPPSLFNSMIGGHQPSIQVPAARWRDRLRWIRSIRRVDAVLKQTRTALPDRLAAVRRDVLQLTGPPLAALPDLALIERIDTLCSLVGPDDPLLSGLVFGGGGVLPVRLILEKVRPGRGTELASALMAARGGITTAEHGTRLLDLSALCLADPDALAWIRRDPRPDWTDLPKTSPFRRGFSDFLATFGHRSIDEIDIASPRWRENPQWLIDVIQGHIDSPADFNSVGESARQTRNRQARNRQDNAWAQVPLLLRPLIRAMTRTTATDSAAREDAKSALVFILDGLRRLVLELGRRLAERGDLETPDSIFFCTRQELWHHILRSPLPLRLRSAERAASFATHPTETPAVIIGGQPQPLAPALSDDGTMLSGMGVSGGVVRGTARLLRHPQDGHRLQAGDILVAPATDPAWTPLFLRAGAIVAETGGWISHTAIVAREYGLPAVVNCPDALRHLQDGAEIEVDGNAGVIRFLR